MSNVFGRLLILISRLLRPDERDAVLGDLTESGETPAQALCSLLGLIVHQQAAPWIEWRPWLALIGVVGILGPRLMRMAWEVGTPAFMDLQIYWKYGTSYSSGLTPHETIISSLSSTLGLVFWSWTSGFVMGALSRRTIWITGTVFLAIWSYPLTFKWMFWMMSHRGENHSAPGLSVVILMMSFQGLLQSLFFALPITIGVRLGLRKPTLSVAQACAITALMILVVSTSVWTGGWSQAAVTRWATGTWNSGIGWQSRLLSLAILSWPVTYLFVVAFANTPKPIQPLRHRIP